MGRENFQRLDANQDPEPYEDRILLLPLFPKGRRGSGRGGSLFSLPLSPALSPLVPRGEREKRKTRRSFCGPWVGNTSRHWTRIVASPLDYILVKL